MTVSNNTAAGDFGAIKLTGDLKTDGDATFDKNTAGGKVGAMSATSATVGGALTVTNNSAVGDNGAFKLTGALNVTGDATFDANKSTEGRTGALEATTVTVGGAFTATNNAAAGYYGAFKASELEVGGDATITGNASGSYYGAGLVSGAVTIKGDATISNNKAAGAYGAISAKSFQIGTEEEPATVVIADNEAGTSYGAIYAVDSFTVNGSVEATGNKAATIAKVTTEETEDGNVKTVVTTTTYSGGAGALYVKEGDATITGAANFSNNEASAYGAVYVGGALTTGELTLSNNKATGSVTVDTAVTTRTYDENGELVSEETTTTSETKHTSASYGAAYVKGAITVNGNATITSNSALASVGAVYGDSMTVDGALVARGNSAAGETGAIRLTGDLNVTGDATFDANTAGASIGALTAANATVDGALTATNNSATGSYGAIRLTGDLDVTGDATFDTNTADAGYGAASAANATVGGAFVVTNNTAATSYGAFRLTGALDVAGSATITGNTAGASYGAGFVGGDAVVGGSATIADNKAGGEVGAIRATTILIGTEDEPATVVISNNEAGANYGAIFAKESFTVNGSVEATGNKAATVAKVSTETTEDGNVTTVVTTTTVSGKAGALYVDKGDATITGAATFADNTAAQGGAVYVNGALTTGELTLTGNKANGAVTVETTTTTRTYDEEGNLVSEETTATSETTHVGANYGAAFVKGAFTINGNATISGNEALGDGGAIRTSGDFSVSGAATITGNTAGGNVGAVSVGGSALLKNATITGNTAGGDVGAIRANFLELVNSLVANNKAAGAAGAIYATKLALVNVTVAGNSAANGGGLYVEKSATIDNSVIAGNAVGEEGQGVDIYAAKSATITLRSSLLQNATSTGEKAFGQDWLVSDYRSFIGTDPLFNDAANGDYTLKANSPAVNGGSNELATKVGEYDLAGNARYVGLAIGGEVYAIDLGAFESQTVAAADLMFSESPVNFWYGAFNGVDVDYYYYGEDVILDFSILNNGDLSVTDKFDVAFTIDGVKADGSAYNQTITYRYVAGSLYFDWLDEENWISAGDAVSYARQNLGELPVGVYTLTITLDVNNEVVEYGEEDGSEAEPNNVYTTSFEVHEIPCTVVTTNADGPYNPLDDEVTLREAVEVYAGPVSYSYRVLVGVETYVDKDMNIVSVNDGVATVDYNVATLNDVETELKDGDSFNYRNTYVTYDAKTATFTYPDGTVEPYARTSSSYSLTITTADGSQYVVKPESKIEYLDNIGEPYSDTDLGVYVDVVVAPDGSQTLLEDLTPESILYRTEKITYRQFVAIDADGVAVVIKDGDAVSCPAAGIAGTFKNGAIVAESGSHYFLPAGGEFVVGDANLTYVGSAFVNEGGDGAVIQFVEGATIDTIDGTLAMGVAQRTIVGSVDLHDGDSVTFNEDGSTIITRYTDNEIVFVDALVDNPTTITLDGSEITIAKDMTINAFNEGNITIDADGQSRIFVVNANVNATISTLTLADGAAITGGAIANYGTLTLKDVNFVSNEAISDGTVDSDKVLREGLGGAIYSTGALNVNGGKFEGDKAAFFGGAIYSVGALTIDGTTFTSNESGLNGGAVFVLNSNATIANAVFEKNTAARNGGAVALSIARNSGAVTITNSKLVENKATSGGAVYAYAGSEGSASISLVNDTIAKNTAQVGGGVYAENATVSLANTIVATNKATNGGVDIALVSGATATATNSLVGNGEDVVTEGALTATKSFVGTTDAPVNPKFASNYALNVTSPAINTGSNELAVYADGSAITKDVNGATRIVGVEKDGVIYAVDMGAVEYQRVVAPDLTFPTTRPALSGWFTTIDGDSTGEFAEGWDVCFDYAFGNYGQTTVFNSFNYTITVAKLDEKGDVVEGSEKTYSRTYGEEVNGFLPQGQELAPRQVVSDMWNLGVFDAGQYVVTFTVDSGDAITETNENNNVFTTGFSVAERPSLVVTTADDVVNSYDGVTSLREAIGRVSETGESTITATRPLANGDTFTLAAYEELGVVDGTVATYADGAITFVNADGETVALQANVAYPLVSGSTLTFDGDHSALLSETLGSTITFASNVHGSTITLVGGELAVDRNMEIAGDDTNITIDANGGRAFMVAHGDEIVIRGLTVANGAADKGAAIYNAATNLVLTNMAFTANNATNGGAIYNADGATLDAANVSFTNNSAETGGAIENVGTIVLSSANFAGNKASDAGAAIYNEGSATISDAEFASNVATDRAGAIYNAGTLEVTDANFSGNSSQYGGAIVNYQGSARLADVTFAGNTASHDAGAIDNYGELVLTNAEFSNNTAQGFGGAVYNSASSTNAAYLVELDGASFTGNSATRGGAIYNSTRSAVVVDSTSNFANNSATEDGGAIYNLGTFNSEVAITFSANEADGDGGALYNGVGAKTTLTGANFTSNVANNGGAVYNGGTFNATTSNFESNVAAVDGGAIDSIAGATTSVSNSVVWKNSAGANGGAIVSAGTLRLRNTTVAGNAAGANGGGLSTSGATSLYNTIVASNYATKGVDLYATKATNVYYSLIGVTAGSNVMPTMVQSKTGDAGFVTAPVFENGALKNASAVDLSLVSDSAAVNSGNDAWALDATGSVALATDFAGNERICTSLDSVDMGAYEFPFEEPSTVVNTDKDVYDLTDGVISIREAIDYAVRLGQDTVTVDPSVTKIELGSTLEINDSIKIVSETEGGLTLASNGFVGSVVAVGTTTAGQRAEVELENITITGGYSVNPRLSDDPNYIGGGLCNYATLTLTNVTIDGNEASYGGGFYNAGDARVIGSTISNNSATYYGGVYNRGTMYVEDSTIAGNTARYYGGGVGTYSDATIVNSTIVGNVAARGAGVYQQINATDLLSSDTDMATNLVNTTITGNVATEVGAGVWANHVLNVDNSIVYDNVAPKNADVYYTTIFGTSAATFRYSNVGVSNVKVTGTGVKSADPGFKSFEKPTKATATTAWKNWDLTLAIGSAMIDSGSTALARGENGELTLDHAGLTRVIGKSVDIGAYEEQGNTAPTDVEITLSDDVNSAIQPGATIATLKAVDADEDDSFTYELVADDSGVLAIDGDKVVVTGELPAGDYTATIRATDEGGASVEKTFEFVVSDPSATNYATPTITTIGVASSGDMVVAWTTDDPAKEYVVEYRVKGTSKWQSTGSLTGTFGTLVDANFKVGDVVQARIKALTSSTKNESEWSSVVEYEIAAPTPSYNVSINENALGSYHVANIVIESNIEPYAWWAIDWNDGSGVTSVTGLSMSQTLSHLYTKSGVYTPILYVDNQEGVALNSIVVNVASGSGATLEVAAEPVFSEIEPVAVYGPVPVSPALLVSGGKRDDSAVVFQTTNDEITVDSAQTSAASIVIDTLAAPSTTTSSVAIDAFFADMAENDDELETDLADSIFNDEFINDLFEN